MPIPPLSRRRFLATTGGALLASTRVPAWADLVQPLAADDAVRAEVADAALARATALGASYADIRINRYRRESIATRERQVQNVSRLASYGLGLRVLVKRRLGLRCDQPRRARCGQNRRGTSGRNRACQRRAGVAESGPRQRRQNRHDLDQRLQA
jgi:hypothetical protein